MSYRTMECKLLDTTYKFLLSKEMARSLIPFNFCMLFFGGVKKMCNWYKKKGEKRKNDRTKEEEKK